MNEKEMKETITKTNKTTRWFLEKINKIEKLLPRSIMKKKGRRLKSIKPEMKKENFQQTTQKYEGS